jgi:hypothetical protein
MRVSAFSSLLALPVTVLADYNTVLSDIKNISTLLTTLTDDVKAVVPGIPGLPYALQVQVDAKNLDKRIQTGAADANASEPFGDGSLQVGLALINLKPEIESSLKQIEGKNETFGELGVIVLSSLLQLKRDTTAFSDQIVPKLADLEAGIAPGIVDDIEKAFDGAIAAYTSNGEFHCVDYLMRLMI